MKLEKLDSKIKLDYKFNETNQWYSINQDSGEVKDFSHEEKVSWYSWLFQISFWKLKIGDHDRQGKYLLEIDYLKSYWVARNDLNDKDSSNMPLWRWNDWMNFDFAKTAHDIAIKYCEANWYNIVEHVSSFPILQAVLIKNNESLGFSRQAIMDTFENINTNPN